MQNRRAWPGGRRGEWDLQAQEHRKQELSMPTLIQLYEYHAEDCIRSAAKADDPKQRDLLLKLASAWREDAERLARNCLISQVRGQRKH
jgi:hypothetical protein